MQLLHYGRESGAVIGAQAAKEKVSTKFVESMSSRSVADQVCTAKGLPRSWTRSMPLSTRTEGLAAHSTSTSTSEVAKSRIGHSPATHGVLGSAREGSRAAGGTAQKPRKGKDWRGWRRKNSRHRAHRHEAARDMKEIAHQPSATDLLFLTNTITSIDNTYLYYNHGYVSRPCSFCLVNLVAGRP